MKTRPDTQDERLASVECHAQAKGGSQRSLVQGELRAEQSTSADSRYELADLRIGDAGAPDPLERYTWPELRELIYQDRE